MRTVLRSTLETAIRDETEVYDHVSQTELWRRIDSSYRKAFDLLIEAYGQAYFRSPFPATASVVAGTSDYDLPSDFYQSINARAVIAGEHVPLTRVDPQNLDAIFNLKPSPGRRTFWYDIVGRQRTSAHPSFNTFKNVLVLYPTPAFSFTAQLDYVPHAASLEEAGDVRYADVNGWLSDYVVADVSAFCMRKREQDPSPYLLEREEAVARIVRMRDARDAQPGRVRDVRSRRFDPCDDEGYDR